MVHESIKKDFTAKLTQRAQTIKVGNGLEHGVEMGPAVSQSELEKDLRYIEIGEKEGAKQLNGGKKGTGPGYFIRPTVFDDVFPDMRIAKEEIFGRVLGVLGAKNVDEAVELANKSEYGLTAGVITSSLSSAMDFADRVEAGVVKVNRPSASSIRFHSVE